MNLHTISEHHMCSLSEYCIDGVLLVAYLCPNEMPEKENRSTTTKSHSYTKLQDNLKRRLELCTVENFGPGGSKNKVIKFK